MTATLRIVLAVVMVLYFVIVIAMLRKKRLALNYSLFWLAFGVLMSIAVAFPQILEWVRIGLGFESAMNAFYVFMIGASFVLIMMLTSIVSKQSEKIKDLVQHNALLEKRIREIEKDNDKDEQ